jgi:flagellar biosynthetic protein FliQ
MTRSRFDRTVQRVRLGANAPWTARLAPAVAVLAFAGPWMLSTLVEYLQRVLQSLPAAVA